LAAENLKDAIEIHTPTLKRLLYRLSTWS